MLLFGSKFSITGYGGRFCITEGRVMMSARAIWPHPHFVAARHVHRITTLPGAPKCVSGH